MSKLTTAPRDVFQTFLNFPLVEDLDTLKADVAIIGMPYGDPYTIDELINDQTNAPTAVRRASQRISQGLDRYDFDIGGPVFAGQDIKVVDVGDVPGNAADHVRRASNVIRVDRERCRHAALRSSPSNRWARLSNHAMPVPVIASLKS